MSHFSLSPCSALTWQFAAADIIISLYQNFVCLLFLPLTTLPQPSDHYLVSGNIIILLMSHITKLNRGNIYLLWKCTRHNRQSSCLSITFIYVHVLVGDVFHSTFFSSSSSIFLSCSLAPPGPCVLNFSGMEDFRHQQSTLTREFSFLTPAVTITVKKRRKNIKLMEMSNHFISFYFDGFSKSYCAG